MIPENDDQNAATESQSMFYPKWKVKPGKGKVASFSNVDEETTDQADTEIDEEDIDINNGHPDWDYSWGLELEITFARLVTVYVWQVYLPRL